MQHILFSYWLSQFLHDKTEEHILFQSHCDLIQHNSHEPRKSAIFHSNRLLIGYIDLLSNTHATLILAIIQKALQEIMCILGDSCLPQITRGNQQKFDIKLSSICKHAEGTNIFTGIHILNHSFYMYGLLKH